MMIQQLYSRREKLVLTSLDRCPAKYSVRPLQGELLFSLCFSSAGDCWRIANPSNASTPLLLRFISRVFKGSDFILFPQTPPKCPAKSRLTSSSPSARGNLWSPELRDSNARFRSKNDLSKQLVELKNELLTLRVQKIAGGSASKLTKMCEFFSLLSDHTLD
jgi:ribosomal protein L29